MTVYTVPYGGLRLDKIANRLFQTERNGSVEALLASNPGLASIIVDGIVPAGTAIKTPKQFTPKINLRPVVPWK